VLGVIATLTSAIGSRIPSKWNDETATTTAASRTLGQLWQMVQNIDAVHGLYYLFMHSWIMPFGTSNFSMRLPSAIAVGVACAGVVVLGTRLGTRRIALYSAAVFLVLPRVTWMGAEARSYAFTALVAVWLTILLVRIMDSGRERWWVIYTIVAAVGVILNIYLALLVLAHGVALLLALRRSAGPRRPFVLWIASSAAAALLSSPLASLALRESGQLPFQQLTVGNVANSLLLQQYFTGATPTLDRYVQLPPTSLWAIAAVVLACIGWALMIAAIVFRRIHLTADRRRTLGLITVTVPWIVLPFAVIVTLSIVVTPAYTARYLSFTTPAVALLMGMSISALTRRWLRVAAIGVIAIVALPIYLSQRGPTSKNATDWQQAAAVLAANAKPGQDVYFGPIETVGSLTTAKIRYAYPGVVSQLNDITLDESGVEANTLWDSQFPLSDASTTLRTTHLLWAVVQHSGDESALSSVQVHYIESAGLRLEREWLGPSTDVLLFTR
jgi:mannosyltransferase